MNTRQRLLSILNHQLPDRIPWVPRLELWYNARIKTHTMPSQWQGASLRQIERDLKVGTPARTGQVYQIRYEGVEIVTREEKRHSITEYVTPLGTLRQVTVASQDLAEVGIQGLVKEHLLKTVQDYRVWEWIVEHMQVIPTYAEYQAYDREIGEDGLPMVQMQASPLWDFLEVLAGFEEAYYQLADYPAEVERLLAVMTGVYRERLWPVVAASPAQLILTDVHLGSQLTPPPLFRKYLLPYHLELSALLHRHGKKLAMHADADTSRILPLIETAGWDMVECFVTAPMAPVTIEQARQVWGERMILWGGVPSVYLSPDMPEEQFHHYMANLFEAIAPGKAFILGIADNAMPDSLIERVAWISEFVEENGWVGKPTTEN